MDFGASFAGTIVYQLDAGLPITAGAGVHSGCYELFAHEPIRNISDLKGRRVGVRGETGEAERLISFDHRQARRARATQ